MIPEGLAIGVAFGGTAAGAMIYVVIQELVPESQIGGHADLARMEAIVDFIGMIVQGVALGSSCFIVR